MADPAPPAEEPEAKPSPSKTKQITYTVIHVLLHTIFILYFIGATVIFVLYDKESDDCVPPESPAKETTETVGNSSELEPVTTNETSAEFKDNLSTPEKAFTPKILCNMNWCHGYGFLLIFFVLFYILWLYYWVFKPFVGIKLYNNYLEPAIDLWIKFSRTWIVSGVMLLVVVSVAVAYLGYECRSDINKAIGLLGPLCFILIGFAASKHHKRVPWRIVTHGLLGQLLLGIICLRVNIGQAVFECLGEKVTNFLAYTQDGARFVYGDRICNEYVFAFAILAVVFFFSVITSIMYYLGWMQFVLSVFGFLLQATVGTTVCESVNAAANVFLSMTEGPLIIRPYIPILTISELHTICTSGYASVSGSVFGAYVSFGASAAFLISASVMAAPGALAFSKLFYPETEESLTRSDNIKLEKSQDDSILDAAAGGAAAALLIVLGIVANIIAFLAIVSFLNALTEWTFELIGLQDITLLYLLSQMFVPVVFVMGVPWHDCQEIGRIVAEKSLINEFVAYKHLGELMREEKVDPRSAAIATFAICGFANPGSLGILIAGLSAMAPTRRPDITKVAVRAYFSGSFVSFTSASIAGILI
ncbi:sodium/nucleoside cotransporter 1 isoform X2 [Drosophila gunungcola]|uniref:sodium/nucleoside cotransporter 1 isoform X2 n=1 Tax=Drosophila gunungcola TaxID=103775 RepID=UPI0022E87A5C|nr:sodium/nucleoside cotransporter 1 isoform X2 [Drosophila gunungcola]